MDEPTARPWKAFRQTESKNHGYAITTVDDKGPDITGWGAVTLTKANAQFIVKACNLYDQLLEALERLIDVPGNDTVAVMDAWDNARSVLTKAKGIENE